MLVEAVKNLIESVCPDDDHAAREIYQDILAGFTGSGIKYAKDGEVRNVISTILNTVCPSCGKGQMWMSSWDGGGMFTCCDNMVSYVPIKRTEDCMITITKWDWEGWKVERKEQGLPIYD